MTLDACVKPSKFNLTAKKTHRVAAVSTDVGET